MGGVRALQPGVLPARVHGGPGGLLTATLTLEPLSGAEAGLWEGTGGGGGGGVAPDLAPRRPAGQVWSAHLCAHEAGRRLLRSHRGAVGTAVKDSRCHVGVASSGHRVSWGGRGLGGAQQGVGGGGRLGQSARVGGGRDAGSVARAGAGRGAGSGHQGVQSGWGGGRERAGAGSGQQRVGAAWALGPIASCSGLGLGVDSKERSQGLPSLCRFCCDCSLKDWGEAAVSDSCFRLPSV